MRTVYRVLAWIIAVEVLLQAAAITYAVGSALGVSGVT